jgi:hypothetical protein
MAYQIPYTRETFKIPDGVIPGNSVSDNPVEFDLAPAWGADLARVRSMIQATVGLVQEVGWTEQIQQTVLASFETGAGAFVNTVEAVRGLTVPAIAAKRAGLITEIPTHIPPGKTNAVPNLDAPFAIASGLAFSRVCGAMSVIALMVAMRIAEISQKAEAAVDPRLFEQPSGSGGVETPRRTATTARPARRRSRRRGTAGKNSTAKAGPVEAAAPGQDSSQSRK